MNTTEAASVVVETPGEIKASVIWLHGLGADGHDFEPIVPELDLGTVGGVRFIFPHAPVRPITLNGGMPMRGWYDITSLDFSQRKEDAAGIKASAEFVGTLFEAEVQLGMRPDRIVIAGFSQGGAIALYSGLTQTVAPAGILALSTYLPLADSIFGALPDAQRKDIPLFMAHGTFDDVIRMRYAEASREALEAQGFKPQFHAYPMGHQLMAEEIRDISNWLQTTLA